MGFQGDAVELKPDFFFLLNSSLTEFLSKNLISIVFAFAS